MNVLVTEDIITTNTAGQTVESIPVVIGETAGVDSVAVVEDELGIPVRVVLAADEVYNSAEQRVDPLWVTGLS